MRTYRAKRVEPRYVLTAQAGLSFGFAEIHLLSVILAQCPYALTNKFVTHTAARQGLIAQIIQVEIRPSRISIWGFWARLWGQRAYRRPVDSISNILKIFVQIPKIDIDILLPRSVKYS